MPFTALDTVEFKESTLDMIGGILLSTEEPPLEESEWEDDDGPIPCPIFVSKQENEIYIPGRLREEKLRRMLGLIKMYGIVDKGIGWKLTQDWGDSSS